MENISGKTIDININKHSNLIDDKVSNENYKNTETETVIFTDFDGTLTVKDSYTMSLIYYGGYKRLVVNIFSLIYNFSLFFFGRRTRNDLKNLTLTKFFKGKNLSDLKKFNTVFIKNNIRYFKNVIRLIDTLKKGCINNNSTVKVVLVTASPNIYIENISEILGFDGYICTLLETDKNGIITGKMIGENCNYKEKVNRIKKSKFYNKNSKIISLGNSKGDYEMFKISDEYYFIDKNGKIERNKKINDER